MCCEGKEIDYKDLRTPYQQEVMRKLGSFLSGQLGTPGKPMGGATPFPGMLSAPPDPSMLAAMTTMMGMGGYGGYKPMPFPAGPLTGPGMPNAPGYSGGGHGGGRDDGDDDDPGGRKNRGFRYDPGRPPGGR